MTFLMFLYFVNTLLFCWPIWNQFITIVESPPDDKDIIRKTEILIVSMCMLTAMWLSYFGIIEGAWFFFLVAILVRTHKYSKK